MSNSPKSFPKDEAEDGGNMIRWEPQSLALPPDPVADAVEARLGQCFNRRYRTCRDRAVPGATEGAACQTIEPVG